MANITEQDFMQREMQRYYQSAMSNPYASGLSQQAMNIQQQEQQARQAQQEQQARQAQQKQTERNRKLLLLEGVS